jgi:sulfide:quinone oxidoreductase
MTRVPHPLRVLVAGGGFAAAEAVLALRAYAGDRVDIEIVAPEQRFSFRPATTAALFTDAAVASFDLAALARDTGATLLRDRLAAVAPDVKRVRLASGAQRDYDALVLALGARARAAVPGSLTFRDQRDAPQLERLVDDLRAGGLRSLALTVPAGVTWTLPVYELALLAAGEVDRLGLSTRVTLVTPERRELEVFGAPVGAAVSALLADREVRVIRAVAPRLVDRRGLRLADGGTVAADRVVAAPALAGPRIPGVPGDFGGFVQTRTVGRVEGLAGVYAAGDMTSFPVKQGGLAAQQADAIAAAIARRAGADPPLPPLTSILRAQLFGAPEPLFLEAMLDASGAPLVGRSQVSSEAPWWPHGTLFGRHVTPWMAQQALAAA